MDNRCRNFRNNALGNGRYDRHCEELHPLTVQAGKAMQCNDVAIFLLLLHRCQVRTCGVVISKGRSPRNGNASFDVFGNQYRCHFSR